MCLFPLCVYSCTCQSLLFRFDRPSTLLEYFCCSLSLSLSLSRSPYLPPTLYVLLCYVYFTIDLLKTGCTAFKLTHIYLTKCLWTYVVHTSMQYVFVCVRIRESTYFHFIRNCFHMKRTSGRHNTNMHSKMISIFSISFLLFLQCTFKYGKLIPIVVCSVIIHSLNDVSLAHEAYYFKCHNCIQYTYIALACLFTVRLE